MKRKAKGGCWIVCGVLAVIGSATLFTSRPKSLLDYATEASNTADWEPSHILNRPFLQFCWLSPTEVLYGRNEDGLRLRLMRKRIDRPSEPSVALPLTVPAAAINWQVSPDARSISWEEYKFVSRRGVPMPAPMPFLHTVASLDGKSTHTMSSNDDLSVWAADSASVFVSGGFNGDIPRTIYRVSFAKGKIVKIPFQLSAPRVEISGARTPVYRLAVVHHFNDGRIRTAENGLFYMAGSSNTRGAQLNDAGIRFADYDLAHPSSPAQTWLDRRPSNTDSGSVVVSPQGDRLFWQTSKTEVPFLDLLIQRVIPSYKVHAQRVFRLLVSDIQGHGMHEIAVYRANPNAARAQGISSPPKWTPDGKKISFVMKGRLYTIPAE